jgi:hypothetical protein
LSYEAGTNLPQPDATFRPHYDPDRIDEYTMTPRVIAEWDCSVNRAEMYEPVIGYAGYDQQNVAKRVKSRLGAFFDANWNTTPPVDP